MLALKLKEIYQEKAAERMKAGKAADPKENFPEGTTRDQIGKIAGVSHAVGIYQRKESPLNNGYRS